MNNNLPKYPAYKPSGVEWLGEIPEHWEAVSLGSIIELKSDKNHPDYEVLSVYREYGVIKKDSRDDNHNATSLDTSNYKGVELGDLVVNKMKAWQGSMGISAYKGIVSPAYITCKVNAEKIHPEYLHQLLRCNLYIGEYNRLSYGVRVGQWDMHYEDFKHITTSIPPISEQVSIANFLSQKTALIEQAIVIKEKQIELLKERRQILINKAVTRGLNPNVKMKDSGVEWIGEIPEHWGVTSVKHILEMPICDGPHTTPQLHDAGIPFVSAEAIKNGEVDFNKIRGFISLKDHQLFSKKYSPKRNDIYMVKSGATTGNVAMVKTDIDFSIWSPLAVFRANQNKVIPNYLHNYLESPTFKRGVELSWSFGTQQNIGMGILSNLPIAYPNIEEQILISEYISRQTDKILSALSLKQQEIERLKEYKAVLINGAVTGKIKVN